MADVFLNPVISGGTGQVSYAYLNTWLNTKATSNPSPFFLAIRDNTGSCGFTNISANTIYANNLAISSLSLSGLVVNGNISCVRLTTSGVICSGDISAYRYNGFGLILNAVQTPVPLDPIINMTDINSNDGYQIYTDTANNIPNFYIYNSNNSGILHLHSKSNVYIETNKGSSTHRFTFNNNGTTNFPSNITISGITNTEKLLVKGISSSGQAEFGTTTDYFNVNAFTGDTLYMTTNNSTTTLTGIGTASNAPLTLMTNNLQRVRITNDGKVGIGTTTPLTPLDVSGIITSTGYSTTETISGNFISAVNMRCSSNATIDNLLTANTINCGLISPNLGSVVIQSTSGYNIRLQTPSGYRVRFDELLGAKTYLNLTNANLDYSGNINAEAINVYSGSCLSNFTTGLLTTNNIRCFNNLSLEASVANGSRNGSKITNDNTSGYPLYLINSSGAGSFVFHNLAGAGNSASLSGYLRIGISGLNANVPITTTKVIETDEYVVQKNKPFWFYWNDRINSTIGVITYADSGGNQTTGTYWNNISGAPVATGRANISISGYYDVSFDGWLSDQSSGVTEIHIRLNGSNLDRFRSYKTANVSYSGEVVCRGILYCKAGDYVEVYLTQGKLHSQGQRFTGVYLGPSAQS